MKWRLLLFRLFGWRYIVPQPSEPQVFEIKEGTRYICLVDQGAMRHEQAQELHRVLPKGSVLHVVDMRLLPDSKTPKDVVQLFALNV